MNSDTETLAAISAGYRTANVRFEKLRIKDIRESNVLDAIPSFDLAFKSALLLAVPDVTVGLTKLQRVLFGVDK